MRRAARRCSSCTTSIHRRKPSTLPSPPGAPVGWARRSSNWTSFLSPWARAWGGYEVGAGEDGASLRDRDDRERLDASRCPSLAQGVICHLPFTLNPAPPPGSVTMLVTPVRV